MKLHSQLRVLIWGLVVLTLHRRIVAESYLDGFERLEREFYRDVSAPGGGMQTVNVKVLDSGFTYRSLQAGQASQLGDREYKAIFDGLKLSQLDAMLEIRWHQLAAAPPRGISRAIEQRLYWEMFDALFGLEKTCHPKDRDRVARSLDKCRKNIRRVALTTEDLADLGKPQDVPDMSQFLDRLPASWQSSVWLPISQRGQIAMHSQVVNDRSYFDSYASAPQKSLNSLSEWVARRRANPGEHPAPKPPDGTIFALVRRMVAVTNRGDVAAVDLIESINFRAFHRSGQSSLWEEFAQFVLDLETSRKAQRAVYEKVKPGSMVWQGTLVGAPDFYCCTEAPVKVTIEKNCASCHALASPGPGDAMALTFATVSGDSQADMVVQRKRNSHAFHSLRKAFQGGSGL